MRCFKAERSPVRGYRPRIVDFSETTKGLTLPFRPFPLLPLSAQAVQTPAQLRRSFVGMVGEAARACSGPKGAFAHTTTFDVALIHPIPLGFPKALFQLWPSRLLALGDQVLICPIEICVVLNDGAIETGALVDRSRRVARVT